MCAILNAQVQYKEIPSKSLSTNRQIKIQLPRNYEQNLDKKYPIILTLDGDYLFEPVAGNVDFYSYWEDMPECIVVGITQADTRSDDTYYDEISSLPTQTGAAFFEFIGLELMPYLDKNYRTSNFKMAIGHDQTANFINYYLMKSPSLFNGYIVLSPENAPMTEDRLYEALENTEQKIFYSLATGTEDIRSLKEDALSLDQTLSTLTNENVNYSFDNFDNATHYTLVGRAIPKALENIFSIYRPISKKEYKEELLKEGVNPYQYLVDKYNTIQTLFGLENKVSVNDFTATYTALKKKEQWEALGELGKLASRQYPETLMGSYYTALSLEMSGSPKKAMRIYQSAYLLEEVGSLTKDLMLDKADQIKIDFGYN